MTNSTRQVVGTQERVQMTIFEAPIIITTVPLHIGDPRTRVIPWLEALEGLIALGEDSKKLARGKA
jgi:hypothetical protein